AADGLLSIGAVRPDQIVLHENNTTTARLEAHQTFRGTPAPATSDRALLAVAESGERTLEGFDVGVLIEPYRKGAMKGVMLNGIELQWAGNVRLLADHYGSANHPLGKFLWQDSFVGVGQSVSILGLTIDVLSQNADGSTEVRVSGEMTSGHDYQDATKSFSITSL
ncbi:MAG: hypothetical protein ACO20G_06785, partial [Ilumatobacteraceae bacterium]